MQRQRIVPAILTASLICLVVGCRARPSASYERFLPKLDPVLALPQYPKPSPNGYEVLLQFAAKISEKHRTYSASLAESQAALPTEVEANLKALSELRRARQMEWL
ncbi:MAG: hypothetical protein ABFE08_14455, partial [Armatimonadia bacterium]